jgi:hypothetical protein
MLKATITLPFLSIITINCYLILFIFNLSKSASEFYRGTEKYHPIEFVRCGMGMKYERRLPFQSGVDLADSLQPLFMVFPALFKMGASGLFVLFFKF